ncbi:MAG: DUF1772 domain-containing protein [Deltaproteobacteria bacterium]
MTIFIGFLIVSILLCALVTGFIFTYAVVVMPGFAKLDDRDFIRAFQVTDGVIQNNQPLFMLAWVGSIVSVVATMILGFIEHHGIERWTVIAIGFVYLLGVQGITIRVHLPLNNRLQRLEIDEMDPESLSKERNKFETRWNYFNNIRTLIAFAVSFSLMLFIYAN